jgi:hypothetical protein
MDHFTHRKSRPQTQKGIALVAVLIFSAIFIISGLAFFSLSSYEAGLFQRRQEAAQAFCNAESGAERARWVLVNTLSKSKAQVDSAGMEVRVVELDENGEVIREGQDLIDFYHDVRVTSRGLERGQERELQVVFAPALEYATGAARNAKFYGRANDGSWADFFDRFNDVYIDGKLQYGNRLIGEDEYKYEVACQGDVSLPDFFDSKSDFKDHFQSMADTVYDEDKFFGKDGGTWHTVGDDQIVFVKGDVEIGENVDRWWEKAVDVTVIATGDITVNSGDSGEDDRLVLIAYKNVTMKGNRSSDVLNSVILAGNKFETKGYWGWAGGRGTINGLVMAEDIDMRGYDPLERSGGWKILQDLEILMMNGGIEVLESETEALPMWLNQKSWTEVAGE